MEIKMSVNDNNRISWPQEPHLACVFLLDVSESMIGRPIENINKNIRKLKEEAIKDEVMFSRIDVAIVTFASDVRIVQDFVPLLHMEPITLTAEGSTKMVDGINVAIDLVKDRIKFYRRMGTPHFKPWIFMITDGHPDSDQNIETVAERIHNEESKRKLKFLACGVGEYDKTTLLKLTNRVIELNHIKSIFTWTRDNMGAWFWSCLEIDVQNEAQPVKSLQDARKADPDQDIGAD